MGVGQRASGFGQGRALERDLKARPRGWLYQAARQMEKAVLADFEEYKAGWGSGRRFVKVDAEDFRRVYESMNDDALLGVKRDELVEVAQQCYDVEVARRGLTAMEEVPGVNPKNETAS
jgi:hypothetical protein